MEKINLISLLLVMSFAFAVVSCDQSQPVDNQVVKEDVAAGSSALDMPKPESLPETDGKILVITEEDFVKFITEIDNPQGFQYKGTMPCIVDFYADWCRPCVALNPLLVEVAEKYKGQIAVYKLNIDRAGDVCDRLGITSIPTLFFFKPGAAPGKIVGAPGKVDLEETIQKQLLSDQK